MAMPRFREPPKEYSDVFLEDTDRALPEVLNPNTRYMSLSTIAKGGKAVISAVKDRHLNRVVAYKTLRQEFVNDEIETTRLLREARVSAMLQHPSTIPVYELGRDNRGHYYFTMKLVHGYTLREILDYRERYDLAQLIHVIEQVAHALAHAHTHGVVHRDIKPENILVGPFNEVLVMDWGLAKVWKKDGSALAEPLEPDVVLPEADKSMTGFGKLQGTVCYMSPEQIDRDPGITASTDIYSLGAVLYELLAGQTPFDGDKVYEVLDTVKHQKPPLPSEFSKYPVPRTLEKLCMACLEKDPAARPESMVQVIRTLEQDWASELLQSKPARQK
jgi:serine/threonine-protein kinase